MRDIRSEFPSDWSAIPIHRDCGLTSNANEGVCAPVQTLIWSSVECLGFDHNVKRPGIVSQVSFIHAQKQLAIPLCDEIARTANENEVVVVVADNAYQSARRLVPHQLVAIGDIRHTIRRGKPPATEVHPPVCG